MLDGYQAFVKLLGNFTYIFLFNDGKARAEDDVNYAFLEMVKKMMF